MPKRKSMDEYIDECKRFRDEKFPVDNSRSDHEKNHLVDINNNLSNFVRNSILIMVKQKGEIERLNICLLYTSPSPRDATLSRMPSSA